MPRRSKSAITGELIRNILSFKEARYTQNQIAELLQVPQSTVSIILKVMSALKEDEGIQLSRDENILIPKDIE